MYFFAFKIDTEKTCIYVKLQIYPQFDIDTLNYFGMFNFRAKVVDTFLFYFKMKKQYLVNVSKTLTFS